MLIFVLQGLVKYEKETEFHSMSIEATLFYYHQSFELN